MPLPTIAEVLYCIADYLEEQDLNSLARTNTTYYHTPNSFLYHRNIKISNKALAWAVRTSSETTVRKCLELGASIRIPAKTQKRRPRKYVLPLIADAAVPGHEAVLRLLLERAADLDRVNINHENPVVLAIEYDHIPCLRLLLAQEGSLEVIQLLLEHGADLGLYAQNGYKPLNEAVYGQSKVCVEFLLHEHGFAGDIPAVVDALQSASLIEDVDLTR